MPVAATGLVIVVPVILGQGREQRLPFACYPRFSFIFEPERDRIEFEITSADGAVVENNTLDDVRRQFRPHAGGAVEHPHRGSGTVRTPPRLLALSESEPDEGEVVRFYRATYSTTDDRGDPPIRRELLAEFEMKPASRCRSEVRWTRP